MATLRCRLGGVFRRLGHIVLGAAVLSVIAVVPLRWLSPSTTAFMLQHRLASASADEPHAASYRWVDWHEISPELPLAVVASEDQRFLRHHGLDFEAIGDALDEQREGGRLRGASTISQQVAKNLFLWPGRSLFRKGLEGYLTLLIEGAWSKRRILEVYLNVAEFGKGLYGVEAASERYFGHSARVVDRRQAALLAAVLPSPKRFDVAAPSVYVLERQAWIAGQMDELGLGYLSGLGFQAAR